MYEFLQVSTRFTINLCLTFDITDGDIFGFKMNNQNIFRKLEEVLKEPINIDIINILTRSGFDSKVALSCLNLDSIIEIEQYANEDRSVLEGTSYQNMKTFMFKPGHKIVILNLAEQIKILQKSEDDGNSHGKMSDFSIVLKTFIDTAESNLEKDPRGFRYNEINRYFSTFVYLFCGKACYETLSANLPIPQACTIRKFFKCKHTNLNFFMECNLIKIIYFCRRIYKSK